MARARYLKPSFFTNDRVGALSPHARLLWQGLWCLADRAGRLKDRPARIKTEVLPYDDVDADALLDELMAAGFIVRYEVGGERYIAQPSFVEHQSPHVREPASTIPAPGGHQASTGPASDEHRASTGPAPDEHRASTIPAPDEHRVSPGVRREPARASTGGIHPESESDPESCMKAESESESEPRGGSSPVPEDSYGELVSAYGGRVDERLASEFQQLASEYALAELREAVRACRRANQRCFPSHLRRFLPALPVLPPVPLDDLIVFPWMAKP